MELPLKIIAEYDSATLEPGGAVRDTTIVRFMVGPFGPFEHVFARGPSAFDKSRVMEAKRDTFTGLV